MRLGQNVLCSGAGRLVCCSGVCLIGCRRPQKERPSGHSVNCTAHRNVCRLLHQVSPGKDAGMAVGSMLGFAA